MNYGVTDALAPFPLHNLVATVTCTINNSTVATNMQDVLPIILRLCDPEELANYNDMTPTTSDYLSAYADGVDRMPFQIRRAENAAGGAATARPAILDVGAVGVVLPGSHAAARRAVGRSPAGSGGGDLAVPDGVSVAGSAGAFPEVADGLAPFQLVVQ